MANCCFAFLSSLSNRLGHRPCPRPELGGSRGFEDFVRFKPSVQVKDHPSSRTDGHTGASAAADTSKPDGHAHVEEGPACKSEGSAPRVAADSRPVDGDTGAESCMQSGSPTDDDANVGSDADGGASAELLVCSNWSGDCKLKLLVDARGIGVSPDGVSKAEPDVYASSHPTVKADGYGSLCSNVPVRGECGRKADSHANVASDTRASVGSIIESRLRSDRSTDAHSSVDSGAPVPLTDTPGGSRSNGAAAAQADTETVPEICIAANKAGVLKAKDTADKLLSQGLLDESARWLSKAILVSQANVAAERSILLESLLYANRAFVYTKMSRWSETEKDANSALSLLSRNTKAKYCRAVARHQLGQEAAALDDVEELLKVDTLDPSTKKDVLQLKDMLLARSESPTDDAAPGETTGVRGGPEEERASSACQPCPLIQIEPVPRIEPFPHIHIEPTIRGVEKGITEAQRLFAHRSVGECVKWLSKSIWVLETTEANDVPAELRSILRSNRAVAYAALADLSKSERDCSAALYLDDNNTKARYIRASVRYRLGKHGSALKDVERLFEDFPDLHSNKYAIESMNKLFAPGRASSTAARPFMTTSAPSGASSGW